MENKKINTSSCLFNIDSLKAMHSPWDHWHMHEESRIVCIHIVCALCVCVCQAETTRRRRKSLSSYQFRLQIRV